MKLFSSASFILAAQLALAGISRAEIAAKDSYLKDFVTALEQTWPKNHAVTVVVHGHSVPAGYFKTPITDSLHAYPNLLREGLAKKFPHAVINVIVTAIGGENSVSGAKRFDADVLTHKPDVLLIDYALNDRGPGLEKARAAWSEMITQAKARGIKVILLTPTADQSAKMDDPNDPLNQHAEQIRALAKENEVGLVDSYAKFKDYVHNGGKLTDIMSQVNHPNAKGHELVAPELLSWFGK